MNKHQDPWRSAAGAGAALALAMIAGCSAMVSDLDDLRTDGDACDPRGRTVEGTDLTLQFVGVTPHINQDMFFAVTVGERRSVEAMMVLSTLDDPDLQLVVPRLLPEGPSELAFWADSNPTGVFTALDDEDEPDHQWTRPVCPNGRLTFTHTTPFQDVQDAVSTGAIFEFVPPVELDPAVYDRHVMWVSAIELDDNDLDEEEHARAYFRWSPLVAPAEGRDAPEQRGAPTAFVVGGDILGERRGAIDRLSFYRIEFVIDVDDSGDLSGRDLVCNYDKQQAPDEARWVFEADLDGCDPPDDFAFLD